MKLIPFPLLSSCDSTQNSIDYIGIPESAANCAPVSRPEIIFERRRNHTCSTPCDNLWVTPPSRAKIPPTPGSGPLLTPNPTPPPDQKFCPSAKRTSRRRRPHFLKKCSTETYKDPLIYICSNIPCDRKWVRLLKYFYFLFFRFFCQIKQDFLIKAIFSFQKMYK